MSKIITISLATVLLFFVSHAKAQTSTANNKTWVVSKYWTSFTEEDKKDLLKDFTFQFIQADTSYFLAINNLAADTCKGFWYEEGDKISISLPLEPDNIEKYKIAMLLNRADIQRTEVTPSKLSFRINEVMNYILVEFTER